MNIDEASLPRPAQLTIGQLAAAAGVHVETVRYYQRESLMPTPQRAYGSIRRYQPSDVKRLRFIKRAQTLGFSLEEIATLLVVDQGSHCAETRELAVAKLALVDARMRDLRAMRSALAGMVKQCTLEGDEQHCPAVEALLESCGSPSMCSDAGR